jgi:hypothetical protein
MTRRTIGVLALATSLGLGACGDSGVDVGTDELTEAEAAAIAQFIMSSTITAANSAQASPEGPAMAPYNFESDVDFDAPCPLGGSVGVAAHVSLSGDTEVQGGVVTMAMTQTHKNCVGQSEETGQQFTLNGNPDLSAEFSVASDAEGNIDLSGSFQGSLAWETDGRSGACDISMTFTGSGNQLSGAGSSSVSGSVCGVSVTEEVALG